MGKGRRGWGEGSVYKRADGYWVGQIEAGHCPGGHERKDGTQCTGGERRRVRVVRRTKKLVMTELDELRRRGNAGVAGKDYTVTEWVTWWLDNVKAGAVSDQTLTDYRRWLKTRVTPHIGHIRLRKLTPVHVQLMMNQLAASGHGRKGNKGHGAAARNGARTLLSSALKHAAALQLVPSNPVDHVSGAKAGARLDDALTADEADAVLEAARGDRLYAMLYVAVTLGQREGEQLAQAWTDLDLEADASDMRIDMAKTRAGERTVPLVAGCREVLREHRTRQAAERLAAGPDWVDNGLVYCHPDGRPMLPREVLAWWHKVCDKAGVPRRRWHALRHSAAQRMLDAGVPIEIVSVILGHNGIAVTNDIYGRAKTDRMRKQLSQYEGALTASSDGA